MRRKISLILILCLLAGLLTACLVLPSSGKGRQPAETTAQKRTLATAAQNCQTDKQAAATTAGEPSTKKRPQDKTSEKDHQAEDEDPASLKAGDNDPEKVAACLRAFGRLPEGYVTKREAEEAGWDPYLGNLREVLPKATIGGDRFGNYEGSLPKAKGRKYFEADVNYDGGSRGPERLIFSNDGLIFYTRDHYKTFVDVTDGWPGTPLR